MLHDPWQGELVEVQDFFAARVDLPAPPHAEDGEQDPRVAEEGPEAGEEARSFSYGAGLGILMFVEDRLGEEGAQCSRQADFVHGGVELGGGDVASVAVDVAMVGE